MVERLWIAVAGLSGALAVGAEAAARHLLVGQAHRLDLASTGGRYGLVHAAALLGLAALGRRALPRAAGPWVAVSGWSFTAGLVLFCGSLYLLALGAPLLVAYATPVGGLAFIAGWAALAVAALQH
jgi:uncharacterized membrane protein YgdD (TMEM256/DUF423 family)